MSETRISKEEAFAVWSCNWRSFKTFLDLETQWRAVAGFGAFAWLGLDYASVQAVLQFTRRDRRRQVFEDLRVMEREALAVFAEVK